MACLLFCFGLASQLTRFMALFPYSIDLKSFNKIVKNYKSFVNKIP